jgi:predicted Zn-dependent peptidase
MIQFDRFVLDNGLRVLVHEDPSTPMAVVNVMYDVGARDEDPAQTGFAHLFEHLMFGGSINIKDYDEPLQRAGGENNAYTTNDLTNYYCQLPAQNIETAFWLESDRMLSLAFGEKVWLHSAKWCAKNLKNIISINLTVMCGIKCVHWHIPCIRIGG